MGGVGPVTWVGLWLALLLLTRLTRPAYGAGIFAFAIGYTTPLLGGTVVARRRGEPAV